MPVSVSDDAADAGNEPGLRPLAADEWGDEEYAAYGSMLRMPGDRVPRFGSGHAYDPERFAVVGTFVRHPALAKAFWGFNGYQLQRSSLPLRWRELAILRVAHHRRSAYEWGQHVKIALAGDITAEEIEQLAVGQRRVRRDRPPGPRGDGRVARRRTHRRRPAAADRGRTRHAPDDGSRVHRRHVQHAGDGVRDLAAHAGGGHGAAPPPAAPRRHDPASDQRPGAPRGPSGSWTRRGRSSPRRVRSSSPCRRSSIGRSSRCAASTSTSTGRTSCCWRCSTQEMELFVDRMREDDRGRRPARPPPRRRAHAVRALPLRAGCRSSRCSPTSPSA